MRVIVRVCNRYFFALFGEPSFEKVPSMMLSLLAWSPALNLAPPAAARALRVVSPVMRVPPFSGGIVPYNEYSGYNGVNPGQRQTEGRYSQYGNNNGLSYGGYQGQYQQQYGYNQQRRGRQYTGYSQQGNYQQQYGFNQQRRNMQYNQGYNQNYNQGYNQNYNNNYNQGSWGGGSRVRENVLAERGVGRWSGARGQQYRY